MRTCVRVGDHTSDPLITCIQLPRLELMVAVRDRRELLGVPVAIAPRPGGGQLIGTVSSAAEAYGVMPRMRLGEALARCPTLRLIPPDPVAVADHWEELLVALEKIGAAVEPIRVGVACFDARGLLALYGGTLRAVLLVARKALGEPARFGVAPTRFAAIAAAGHARARSPLVVDGGQREARSFLAAMPVSLLSDNPDLIPDLAGFGQQLRRLGIETLGQLAALPRGAVNERFGPAGRAAHRLASGFDTALRPRTPGERVRESMHLDGAGSSVQLERALESLIGRVLARQERRGRTLRTVTLSAVLVEGGGTWRESVAFREALSDPERMCLALIPHLARVPAPVSTLRLTVERFGPAGGEQQTLLHDPVQARRSRLREAVHQAQAATGQEAALRILQINPDSRFPERRMLLAEEPSPAARGTTDLQQ